MSRAISVNPYDRTIQSVTISNYKSLRDYLGSDVLLHGALPLCRVGSSKIYLQCWMDCKGSRYKPAWRSSMAPRNIYLRGLRVIDALDLVSNKRVDCPLSAEEFASTVKCEDYLGRKRPDWPNPEWFEGCGDICGISLVLPFLQTRARIRLWKTHHIDIDVLQRESADLLTDSKQFHDPDLPDRQAKADDYDKRRVAHFRRVIRIGKLVGGRTGETLVRSSNFFLGGIKFARRQSKQGVSNES